MSTKRLAAATLRGASARASVSAAPLLHAPRASFTTAPATLRTSISPARLQSLRDVAPKRRGYSTDTPQSQFWTFEQISIALHPSNADAKPRVKLIDVREPDEIRKTGRIPGAQNVPMMSQPDSFHITADEFRERFGFERPAGDDKVVFYCKAGVRSRTAAEVAMRAGWSNVGEYPGSWLDWIKNGGDIQMGGKIRKADRSGGENA